MNFSLAKQTKVTLVCPGYGTQKKISSDLAHYFCAGPKFTYKNKQKLKREFPT